MDEAYAVQFPKWDEATKYRGQRVGQRYRRDLRLSLGHGRLRFDSKQISARVGLSRRLRWGEQPKISPNREMTDSVCLPFFGEDRQRYSHITLLNQPPRGEGLAFNGHRRLFPDGAYFFA